jgi:hypothetical protein
MLLLLGEMLIPRRLRQPNVAPVIHSVAFPAGFHCTIP